MSKIFIISLLFVSGILSAASAEWRVDLVSDQSGNTQAIGLDSSGMPRIAFGDSGAGAKLATYTGTYWSQQLIYYEYNYECQYYDIIIDESDLAHVSFAISGMIMYAAQNTTLDGWDVDSYIAFGEWNSLGLNSQNYPGISYYDISGNNLAYIYSNGSAWTVETVDSAADTGNYNSMVTEDPNKVHIAYGMNQPTPGLRYASRNEAGVWQTCFVDTSMISEPIGMSIALDGDGYPRISYTTTEDLRYASWDGSSWNVETVWSVRADDTNDTGVNRSGTSLALFQNEYPHIAHCTLDGDSLLYSWNDGTGWQTESICSLGSYPEEHGDPDMALDSEGHAHIAFFGSGGLFYAYNDEVLSIENEEGDIVSVDFTALANPFYGNLNLSFNLPEASHVELTVYDLHGRVVDRLLSENGSRGINLCSWIPEASVPCGEYILVLNTNGISFSQKAVFLGK